MFGLIRVLVMALAFNLAPSCATQFVSESHTIASAEARAHAVLQAYAELLNDARAVIADPAIPLTVKRSLGVAEQSATPAMAALADAASEFVRERSNEAADVLTQALADAIAHMAAFEAALRLARETPP